VTVGNRNPRGSVGDFCPLRLWFVGRAVTPLTRYCDFDAGWCDDGRSQRIAEVSDGPRAAIGVLMQGLDQYLPQRFRSLLRVKQVRFPVGRLVVDECIIQRSRQGVDIAASIGRPTAQWFGCGEQRRIDSGAARFCLERLAEATRE